MNTAVIEALKAPSAAAVETEIAIIGSGFSGLAMAIALRKARRYDFVVLESAGDVGGTWRDNTYPGCGCDVASSVYSFSFEPKPDWPYRYGSQQDIWQYMRHCADKYRVRPHAVFTPLSGALSGTRRRGDGTSRRRRVKSSAPAT
jgi:cation diffusion facilitator CzcD-associated flavoprotein CzcO